MNHLLRYEPLAGRLDGLLDDCFHRARVLAGAESPSSKGRG